MKNAKVSAIVKIVVFLIFLQLLLFGMKQFLFTFFDRTDFFDHMASMISMIIISVLFIVFTRKHNISLLIFPDKFGVLYIIATVVVALLLIATPSNYTGGFHAILLLILKQYRSTYI